MVPNGYNFHEKTFKKVDLNHPFYKQDVVSRDMSHKQSKKQRKEKNLTTFNPKMKRTFFERIKAYVAVNGVLAESRM